MARIRTYSPKLSEINRDWRVIDAEGETLGRLATRIAIALRGKDKPTYTTHMSVGDHVIVVNAEKVRVTGQKEKDKTYYRHSQYPGGLRAVTLATMRETHPDRIIQKAVKGMIPHNVLGRQIMRRLHVYVGPEHPHEAQVRAGQGKGSQRRLAHTEAIQAVEAAPIAVPSRRRRRQAAPSASPDTEPEATATTATEATVDESPATPDVETTVAETVADDSQAQSEPAEPTTPPVAEAADKEGAEHTDAEAGDAEATENGSDAEEPAAADDDDESSAERQQQ